MNAAVPKKLAAYVHDIGARALDHLADTVPPPEDGAAPNALQSLAGNWRSMSAEEKDGFVQAIAGSVGEVIAESAMLPTGIKAGKKAVKTARKVLKRSAKDLKKKVKSVGKKKKSA
jgi:hypothetical protein